MRAVGRDTRGETWVIEPVGVGLRAGAREIWDSRRLMRYLAGEAIKRRYRRTLLGAPWLFLRPAIGVLLSVVLFAGILGVDTGRVPYLLFLLAGTTMWTLFDQGLMWVTRSLEINRRLLRKVYFPRILLPVSHLAPAIVEFAVMAVLLLIAIGYYLATAGSASLRIGTDTLLLLAAVPYVLLLVLALGLWTSILGAYNRDTRFTLRYVLQFWYYVTPVVYPLDLVPVHFRTLVMLNPLTPAVTALRQALFGTGEFQPSSLLYGTALALVGLLSGLWYFHRSAVTSVDQL